MTDEQKAKDHAERSRAFWLGLIDRTLPAVTRPGWYGKIGFTAHVESGTITRIESEVKQSHKP